MNTIFKYLIPIVLFLECSSSYSKEEIISTKFHGEEVLQFSSKTMKNKVLLDSGWLVSECLNYKHYSSDNLKL